MYVFIDLKQKKRMKGLYPFILLDNLTDNPFVAVVFNPFVEPFESRKEVFVFDGRCALLCCVLAIRYSPQVFGGLGDDER